MFNQRVCLSTLFFKTSIICVIDSLYKKLCTALDVTLFIILLKFFSSFLKEENRRKAFFYMIYLVTLYTYITYVYLWAYLWEMIWVIITSQSLKKKKQFHFFSNLTVTVFLISVLSVVNYVLYFL